MFRRFSKLFDPYMFVSSSFEVAVSFSFEASERASFYFKPKNIHKEGIHHEMRDDQRCSFNIREVADQ
jgi:hypothetical protein